MFDAINKHHLSGSPLAAGTDQLFDEPLSNNELEDLAAEGKPLVPPVLPQLKHVAFIGEIVKVEDPQWGPFLLLKSTFNSSKMAGLPGLKKPLPFSPSDRDAWTEMERIKVAKGARPDNLEAVARLVSEDILTVSCS